MLGLKAYSTTPDLRVYFCSEGYINAVVLNSSKTPPNLYLNMIILTVVLDIDVKPERACRIDQQVKVFAEQA